MKITGAHTIAVDQQRAYAVLQEPEVMARCMPGCESLVQIGENEYEMRMKMIIASVQGLFAGKVRIADQRPYESFRLIVNGTGKIGFMNGDGLLTLVPVDGRTEVRFEGDVSVGGVIAGVGQRLLDTTSKMLIKRFFDKLSLEIQRREAA
jgi:carbon monoxide dehydrogenase subunit G